METMVAGVVAGVAVAGVIKLKKETDEKVITSVKELSLPPINSEQWRKGQELID